MRKEERQTCIDRHPLLSNYRYLNSKLEFNLTHSWRIEIQLLLLLLPLQKTYQTLNGNYSHSFFSQVQLFAQFMSLLLVHFKLFVNHELE